MNTKKTAAKKSALTASLAVLLGILTLATASAQTYVTNVNYKQFNGTGATPIWTPTAGSSYVVITNAGPTNPVGPTTTIYTNTTNASLNWISTAANSVTNYYPSTVLTVTNTNSHFGTKTTNYTTLTNTYFWDLANGSNNIAVFTNAYTKYIANPLTSNQLAYVYANGLVNASTSAATVNLQGGNPLALMPYSADGVNFVMPSISSTYGGTVQFANAWMIGSNGVNFSSVLYSTNKNLGNMNVSAASGTNTNSIYGNITSQNTRFSLGGTNNFPNISSWDIRSGILAMNAGTNVNVTVALGGKLIFGAGEGGYYGTSNNVSLIQGALNSYYGTATNNLYATANSGTNTDNMSYVATNSGTLRDTWVGNPSGTGTYGGTGVNLAGNGGFAMAGTGNFILTGYNTFGGVGITNTVNNGTLTASNSSALGNTNNALDVQSGTLNLSIYTTASQEGYQVTNYFGAATNFWVNNVGTISSNANVYQMGGVTIGNGTITSLGGGTEGTLISTNFTTTNDAGALISVKLADAGTAAPFTQNGSGTTTLSGNNTFTGATTVNAGALLINGTNTGSAVTVNGGTLAGTGKVGSVTVSGGQIGLPAAPGAGLNTVNLTLGGATTLQINATNSFSSINILGGTVDYTAGNLVFNFGSYTPVLGNAFTLFNMTGGATTTGDITGITDNQSMLWVETSPGSGIWDANIAFSPLGFEFTTANATLTVVNSVPEPSTYALMGLGLLTLFLAYRRRNA